MISLLPAMFMQATFISTTIINVAKNTYLLIILSIISLPNYISVVQNRRLHYHFKVRI